MQVSKQTLEQAAEKGLITPQQANELWDYIGQHRSSKPRLNATNTLYYLGGCIAIGAMTIFMNLGWESFGGTGLFAIAMLYGVASLVLADYFQRKSLTVVTGIMACLAVAMVPLAVYGLQSALGMYQPERTYREFHQLIDAQWIMIELATILAGLLVLWRYRIAFILMPICVALFYLSLDLAPLLMSSEHTSYSFTLRVSVWFGLFMLLIALATDIYDDGDKDYAFWLYLFGTVSLWGGISGQGSDLLSMKIVYLSFNLLLIAIGTCLMRKVFLIFGGLGVLLVLGDLSRDIFRDSIGFPLSLTLLGLLTIGIGLWWQKNEKAIQARVDRFLPHAFARLRDRRS